MDIGAGRAAEVVWQLDFVIATGRWRRAATSAAASGGGDMTGSAIRESRPGPASWRVAAASSGSG